MKTYDYIIIGAGITGLTLCRKLKEKHKTVLVLEKNDEPGGLCRTKNINGHVLDIGGGHFFLAKNKVIEEFVFSLIPKNEFNIYDPRISKIKIGENTIDYPLESNIWQLPIEQQIQFLISTIRNGESSGHPMPKTYEEWIRWKLGDKICDEYMVPYNTKLWGVSPSKLDVDWLYKIPRVDVKEVLQYSLQRKQDVTKYPAHIYFYYPKHGGFQTIIDAIYKDEKQNVVLNTLVNSLVYSDQIWIINNAYKAKNVINTTPWNDLYDALGRPKYLEEDFQKIQYNKLVVSLYEKPYDVNWHWRYIPDINIDYHREFYIRNFAEDSKKDGIYVETNINRYDKNTQHKKIGKHICSVETDAAYPIPIIGHSQAINKILNYYKKQNLFGIGRWGQHSYQNADVSMYEAFKFVDSIN